MITKSASKFILTDDSVIRSALKERLSAAHAGDPRLRIIDELGVNHGAARIDIAVVNGILHGYEIKSDRDTLLRLPDQIEAYNSVFDQITLVVGKTHLVEAINLVPDWWGITIAKINDNEIVSFSCIRVAQENTFKDSVSIARLLWRNEALNLLEEAGEAKGLRSKTRVSIYAKLSTVFNQDLLGEKVRQVLSFREDWRSDAPLMLSGG